MLAQHQNKIFPLENLTSRFINTNTQGVSPPRRALNFSPTFSPHAHGPTSQLPTKGEDIPKAPTRSSSEMRAFSYKAISCRGAAKSCPPGHDFVFIFSLAFGGKTQPRALTFFVSLPQQRACNARPSTGGIPRLTAQLFPGPPIPTSTIHPTLFPHEIYERSTQITARSQRGEGPSVVRRVQMEEQTLHLERPPLGCPPWHNPRDRPAHRQRGDSQSWGKTQVRQRTQRQGQAASRLPGSPRTQENGTCVQRGPPTHTIQQFPTNLSCQRFPWPLKEFFTNSLPKRNRDWHLGRARAAS